MGVDVGADVGVTEPGALCGVAVPATALLGVRRLDGVVRACAFVAVAVAVVDVVFEGVLAGEDVETGGGLARVVLGERAERRVCAGRARSR